MAYTKLFASIVSSTVWLEDSDTRVVWFTLLALADKNGEVMGSVPGLAHLARVPVEVCRGALDRFMSPDQESRTEAAEGRRIEKIDGGWALINHAKYRRLASKEDSVEKNAERQRRFKNRNSVTVTPGNASVTPANAQVTQDRDIADTDSDSGGPPSKGPPPEPQCHKPSPIAARPPAPEGAASRTPGLTSEDTWRQRLAGYDPHNVRKTWHLTWGPRPDAPGIQPLIPPDLLRAWREQHQRAA